MSNSGRTHDPKVITANISRERKRAGYHSKGAAAVAFKVSRPTYDKFERPEKIGKATLEELEKLADLYGCPLERFFMD